MQLLSWPEARLPVELRSQVWELQESTWPSGQPDPGVSHDPVLAPVSLLLLDGSRVLAALDLLEKEIEQAGERYLARGLSCVVTDPAERGRGYGGRLVAAAREVIRAGGADLGIFSCDRPLQEFYRSAGWRPLPGAVLVGGTAEEPFPTDQPGFDKVVLADLCSARARAAGFERSRIALHPGTHDRLW
ncbi:MULTISPECIES: GNAT family N-acetyltransferase [unclassified Kitasatospora]|uniref:GNAT family N-acetyltransferase n=1 Tax=unclassified Kitasatospora TaxID=2633591 RepID=UPI00070B5B18|nr:MULTISPECIES: GNAT family N-acetyltransferase [unclassified Kitasatospora]KQV18792.1 acetyltransferase [Kitasatospora sp. Root107]KRB74774.1 acetyltransferase [Kitasatospora sp. Root187]